MDRLIFHIDVNSAFLSWTAADRVEKGEPDIRLIPSAIGGDPEKRSGIILAKSIPAKKYGIKTGEPIGMALRKCPELYLARPDFGLYVKMSAAFMDICREYAPVVEKFSIDECFLDMSGTERIYPDPVSTAHEIKDRIRNTLGFTVNVGVGSNKLLAKMASDFEKPDKVHTLFSTEIESKMWPLPVSELFSVGAATAQKLNRHYINTIGELAATDTQALINLFGNKMGIHLHEYSNGIDSSPVSSEKEEAKGYSNSTTLAENVTKLETASNILLALVDTTSARMRYDSKKAYCIQVTIRDTKFKDRSHQRKMDIPTDITSEIYNVVISLFKELWDGTTPLRLLGVALTDLTDEGTEQLSFFDEESSQKNKKRKIDKAVDKIRSRFGSSAITRGAIVNSSQNIGKKHKAQMENKNEKK